MRREGARLRDRHSARSARVTKRSAADPAPPIAKPRALSILARGLGRTAPCPARPSSQTASRLATNAGGSAPSWFYDSTSTTYDELFATLRRWARGGNEDIRDDDGRDHAFVDYFNPDAAQRAVAGLNYSSSAPARTASSSFAYAEARVERDAVAPAPAPACGGTGTACTTTPWTTWPSRRSRQAEAIHARPRRTPRRPRRAAARAAATAAAAVDALPPTVVGQLVPGPLYAAGLHDVTLRADEAAPAPAPATEPRAVLESWSAGDAAALQVAGLPGHHNGAPCWRTSSTARCWPRSPTTFRPRSR